MEDSVKNKHRLIYGIITALILFVLATVAAAIFYSRFHWSIETETVRFFESAKELDNPNQGFYYIYGFWIRDEEMDYEKLVEEKFEKDTETALAMIQINLQEYRNGAISEQGLANIEALFDALEGLDKQLIVRFLYDWDGKNEQYEPKSIDIILGHMSQLEDILKGHSSKIFVLQGLFIGNWGEMNGTRYSDMTSMQTLARQLATVTDDSTYLAVRMPAQWRQITGSETVTDKNFEEDPLAGRLSLFNDGMLGNEGDYGTYGTQSVGEVGEYSCWTRGEELEFQEKLCRRVPNGGEVINENPVNDFENACRDMAMMHVTYINRDYDRNVLNKWAKSVVQTEGCFYGMDGLTYMERHLGYRLLITEVSMEHDFWRDTVCVDVTLKNVGFAPLYKECRVTLILCDTQTEEQWTFDVTQELRALSGGRNAEQTQTISAEIPLGEFWEEHYQVYVRMEDEATGKQLQLANVQERTELGYRIGSITQQKNFVVENFSWKKNP